MTTPSSRAAGSRQHRGVGGKLAIVELIEGQVLAGKYRFERVLGRGGMGVVVAATNIHLGGQVALKFLLPHALENPAAVERFQREARAAVKLKGEHVARVLDVGTLETGAPFIVMEYLEGADVDSWLKRQGRLPVEQAVEVMLQTCEAIAEAHALGIIHRDLKPGNLFLAQRPDGSFGVKVLDFGISKVVEEGAAAMTRTAAMLGSPLYMSPEQLRSPKSVDARTDIWSLGVVLYEMLAREAPFQGETIAELALKVTLTEAPSVRAIRSDVPNALDAVIGCCLSKERDRRYPDVGAFASALAPFASASSRASVGRVSAILRQAGIGGAVASEARGAEPKTLDSGNGALAGTQEVAGTHSAWSQSTVPKPKRRGLLVVGVAAVLLVGVGVFFVLRPSQPAAVGAAPTTDVVAGVVAEPVIPPNGSAVQSAPSQVSTRATLVVAPEVSKPESSAPGKVTVTPSTIEPPPPPAFASPATQGSVGAKLPAPPKQTPVIPLAPKPVVVPQPLPKPVGPPPSKPTSTGSKNPLYMEMQ